MKITPEVSSDSSDEVDLRVRKTKKVVKFETPIENSIEEDDEEELVDLRVRILSKRKE